MNIIYEMELQNCYVCKKVWGAKKNLFNNLSESDSDISTTSNPKNDNMEDTNLLKTQSTSEDQSNTNGNDQYILFCYSST